MGPYSGKETGEHALLRQLLDGLHSGDVLLGDCYYASFFLIAMLMRMGVDAVFPMHAARDWDFRRGKRLGKKDHLVNWKKPAKPKWMELEEYEKFPDTITVREVAVSTGAQGFQSKTRVMVTTFVDEKEVSKTDLSTLYDCRWFVEIALKAIKETMGMDILRAKTPEMVRKEIWAHLLAYNLIRKIMTQAASRYDKNPRGLSFKCALQFIDAFRRSGNLSENSPSYEHLLKAIAYKAVGNRPGRSEPRMVKRRPKAFPRLQNPRSSYHKKGA
jgi:DDE family transposase